MKLAKALFLYVNLSSMVWASFGNEQLKLITHKMSDPDFYLKQVGPLVFMGNASLNSANIVFLPEVHDDPESLTTQLLLIASEKEKGNPFVILDESLASMKKSSWDIFSQKSLEIIAAAEQRKDQGRYTPDRFEMALEKLAKEFKNVPQKLNFLESHATWALKDFEGKATPFYGWDRGGDKSLLERNLTMVESLKKARAHSDRILIMAGARHIPELEFITSQRLLCRNARFDDINRYFTALKQRFGLMPNLRMGIGATTPIYDYLATERYVVVFSPKLYDELNTVVKRFQPGGDANCINL